MATLSPPRAISDRPYGAVTLSALIVDSDGELVRHIGDNLTADRFTVMSAERGEQALTILAEARPDVAVISSDLRDMSGFELVSTLRDGRPTASWDPGMPILMLVGRGDPHAVVRGIDRGADDVLLKPLHYPELLARIGAQVRRAQGVTLSGALRVGPLEIDRRAMTAHVHGARVALSAKEFGLLAALARDPHRVILKFEILRDVWGFTAPGRTRTVDTHASRVRGKLAAAGLPGWVRNVWGQGYRLLPEERR